MELSKKTPLVQKEKVYIRGKDGIYPMKSHIHTDLMEGHCEPSDNNQDWSASGYWVKIPKSNLPTIKTQNEIKSYKAGRIETCIDSEGNRKKFLSYGDDSNNLLVWYAIKDIYRSHSQNGQYQKKQNMKTKRNSTSQEYLKKLSTLVARTPRTQLLRLSKLYLRTPKLCHRTPKAYNRGVMDGPEAEVTEVAEEATEVEATKTSTIMDINMTLDQAEVAIYKIMIIVVQLASRTIMIIVITIIIIVENTARRFWSTMGDLL